MKGIRCVAVVVAMAVMLCGIVTAPVMAKSNKTKIKPALVKSVLKYEYDL